MQLLDLPREILRIILEEIGPDELRAKIAYLVICRTIYQVVQEILLLPNWRVSARQLQWLPLPNSPFFQMIAGGIRRISVRLVGHPSCEISKSDWINWPENVDEEDDSKASLFLDANEEWETRAIAGRAGFSAQQREQRAWMSNIHKRLEGLADRMGNFTALDELIFEASSTQEETAVPRWDYLYDVTLAKLIDKLPNSLTALTVDTCGTNFFSAYANPLHLCPLVAKKIGKIKTVRLRMRCICPKIFEVGSGDLALESLNIKLNLPMLGGYAGGDRYFDVQRCYPEVPATAKDDVETMIAAGNALAQRHTFHTLRISFRDPQPRGITLGLWDCGRNEYLYDPSEVFCYEDEGRIWDWWEESSSLQVGSWNTA